MNLEEQLKQRDETIKELKIEASKWAFECDRAKQDRDKAEKQIQQLKEALKEILMYCEEDGTPVDGFQLRDNILTAKRLIR